jgi:hypothetical protein
MLVHAPAEYSRKVGLRVLVFGHDGEPGDPWPVRLTQRLHDVPGVVWLLPGDLACPAPMTLAWTWQALEDADLVVVRLHEPVSDGVAPLVVGRALVRRELLLQASPDHPLLPDATEWAVRAGFTLVEGDLFEATAAWIRERHRHVPVRTVPESRELEELEREVRARPGEESYQAYWRQLIRLGITDAGELAEIRPSHTQGFGSTRWKTQAYLQGRRISTLAPELGEARLAAPHGELPSEEREGDHHPDHFVILKRSVDLSMGELTATFSAEARWDRGDWGEGGDAPEAARPVLRDFRYAAQVPLIEAVADMDGWVARESRRAVVRLIAALRTKL